MTEITLPGILHFLQSEWRRFESLRNEWQIEKSDLQSQIILLNGEKSHLEIKVADLESRIKMLEFAIKRKNEGNNSDDEIKESNQSISEQDKKLYLPFTKSVAQARSTELLKNYLREANQLLALTSSKSKTDG